MFEFGLVRKYLLPKKGQLSVSLISIVSVAVISLVVWLVLIFLSVTEGIEKGWLTRLTALNAPIRITPTSEYYSSYYYLIDSVSSASGFSTKTIEEKLQALQTDPYSPQEDAEIPRSWPRPDLLDGALKDPVKIAANILEQYQKKKPDLAFQDYEVSGSMMRLEMSRPDRGEIGMESQSYLTQVSYIASLPEKSPTFSELKIEPTGRDLQQLLYKLGRKNQHWKEVFQKLSLGTVKLRENLSSHLIPEGASFKVTPVPSRGQISHILLSPTAEASATLRKKGGVLQVETESGLQQIQNNVPIILQSPLEANGSLIASSIQKASYLEEVEISIKGEIQGVPIEGRVPFQSIDIGNFQMAGSWPKMNASATEILLPKSFQDSGVLIGDTGYLTYSAMAASSMQEQRLPVVVSGFYDPGVMSIGSRFILTPSFVPRTINASGGSFAVDKLLSNGIHVWFDDLHESEKVKVDLQKAFQDAGISRYWKIASFREYEFAKDLLEQFQSDKYLFTLIGAIILTVASCNIISLLVLLVNDKKKEIGIIQALGAHPRNIALIFGLCGVSLGLISCLLGTILAYCTLHNIDTILGWLSFLQGHEILNAAFYGKTLPSELSRGATSFVLILTPILSLLAGLVPAIKAARLQPSEILRAE